MSVPQKTSDAMTAEAFIAWSEHQDARYELFDGHVVIMAAERLTHARTKHAIVRQFEDGIQAAGLPCEACPDGMAVRVDDQTIFEPDALVRRGLRLDGDVVVILDPVIVVEVASPSTQRLDALAKFLRYFRNPSIEHYLIVLPAQATVVHHRRVGDRIETETVERGLVRLDPPGLTLDLDALFKPTS